MLFVGAIHAMDAPNYDSLCWFVDEVLPLVEQELGWETRLTIVGYTAPSVDLSRFADHARITLRGALADLQPVCQTSTGFSSHRRASPQAFPTRCTARRPMACPWSPPKSCADGVQWENSEILAAEDIYPVSFARHIVELYRSEELWQTIRSGALAVCALRTTGPIIQKLSGHRFVRDHRVALPSLRTMSRMDASNT